MNAKYAPTAASTFDTKLGYLIEECGEVLHASGKIIRWGKTAFNPEAAEKETNAEWLRREIADLEYALDLVKGELDWAEK